MDANGQRFWMLADEGQFDLSGGAAAWDRSRRVLRLASRRAIQDLPADRGEARKLAGGPASTIDQFGTWAVVTDDLSRVMAAGALADPVAIYAAGGSDQVLDMTLGSDDVLYLAVGERAAATAIVLLDRRNRWDPVTLAADGFTPDCIALAAEGGVWALDRTRGKLGRVRGLPLRRRPFGGPAPGTARPCRENPDPPQLHLLDGIAVPAGMEPVAMAAAPDGRVAILAWPADPAAPAVVFFFDGERLSAPVQLSVAVAPFTIGWVEGDRWAVLFSAGGGHREALCFDLPGAGTGGAAVPAGDRYPLDITVARRFCNAPTTPVHYLGERDAATRPLPLFRLSMPSLATAAAVKAVEPFDSGAHGTVWHRIYLEAALPPGTGVRVVVAADDERGNVAAAAEAPHHFGVVPGGGAVGSDVPSGAWVPLASEIPFHDGMLPCPPEEGRSGLFTALVQRPGVRVRTVRGRYLRVRVELYGTGHVTPEVAAVRIYGPRFSYLDRYLPELYRETLFGAGADAEAAATGPDFLQRFLCLFEGILTPLEDRVANAYLVTMPETAPDEVLPWLGTWIGLALEPGMPEARQRLMLREATRLYRRRGTPQGLDRTLDIATGGMVSRREIVVLEDFRLRRTFATILGADLANEDDPLLAGIVASGNSYVGDTLFLGEEQRKEFLALFTPEAARMSDEEQDLTRLWWWQERSEQWSVQGFLDELAFKVTVLVHREIDAEELALVKRIVELERPAHVETRVLAASRGLVVGLVSLTGIDTRPGQKELPRPVRVQHSVIGWRDYIQGLGTLDPRIEGGGAGIFVDTRPPEAHVPDVTAEFGASVKLDAAGSRAFGGRKIVRFNWKLTS